MKKIMTLCFFAFAMILGTQTTSAQSMVEVNSLASKKTAELKKVVKFDSDTEDKVYETFQAFIQKKATLDKIKASGETVSAEDKEKIDNMLTEKFQNIFSDEEFKRYLSFVDSKK